MSGVGLKSCQCGLWSPGRDWADSGCSMVEVLDVGGFRCIVACT